MELDRETIRRIRGLIVFAVAVIVAGFNYRQLFDLAAALLHIIRPFVLGAAIAFILNVPMRAIEGRLTAIKGGAKRIVSLLTAVFLVVGILFLVIFVVAPQLFRTFLTIQSGIPAFLEEVQREAEHLFSRNPWILESIDQMEVNWKEIVQNTVEFLKSGAGTMLNTTVSAAVTIVSGVSTFLIGFIFAVYILLQKETLGRQAKKLMRAFVPGRAVDSVLGILSLAERTFSNFLAGQCVEAVILGIMFFVTLVILRLPYALLVGVLIAFTALIPIFGAFIGLGIGAFLMLMVNPMDALIFTIAFFVLQQIEGNLIYPHVVGNSVGLPSIWVLVAVTVGGNMMGVVGMLIFIPLCSVIYTLLREIVNGRLAARAGKAEAEAPVPPRTADHDPAGRL